MKNSFYSWGFVSGVTDLKNPVFVFTKHFLSWEFLYIWGYSSGSFLIFQDTKLHIWGNSCSLTYRKQEGVVALYGNDLPHCLPRPFSKLINLCTVRQFFWPFRTNISKLSKFLLDQFISAWASLIWYCLILSSKCFEAKAISRLFMASKKPSNLFLSVIFKKPPHFLITFASMTQPFASMT